MASERDAAKQSVSGEEKSDPQLTTQLQESADFRLKQMQEENRHKETLHRQGLGWFGKGLGGSDTAPTVVAFIAVLLFSVIGMGCLAAAHVNGVVTLGPDEVANAAAIANSKTVA